jgi:hypothetical protein
MNPLARYANLLRSLPDKQVPNPSQPVLVSLSEHLGAPTGLSVNVNGLLDWAVNNQKLTATTLWKLRDTFAQWDVRKPTRHQVAELLDWLAKAA